MNGSEQFFGIVKNGEFYVFAPQQLEGTSVKLTHSHIDDPHFPDAGIIDLTTLEGKIIEVSGHECGKWLYDAKVDEEAGPVLSNFLKKVFLKDEVRQKRCILLNSTVNQALPFNSCKNFSEYEFREHIYDLIEKKVNHTSIYKIQKEAFGEFPGDINELDPDFLISLYSNTEMNQSTEILYYQISEAGKKIAEILLEHLAAHHLQNVSIKAKTKNDDFGLLFHIIAAPCVIVKLSFMNNELNLLENLESLANAFAKAIDEISKKINLEHKVTGSNVFI